MLKSVLVPYESAQPQEFVGGSNFLPVLLTYVTQWSQFRKRCASSFWWVGNSIMHSVVHAIDGGVWRGTREIPKLQLGLRSENPCWSIPVVLNAENATSGSFPHVFLDGNQVGLLNTIRRYKKPRTFRTYDGFSVQKGGTSRFFGGIGLFLQRAKRHPSKQKSEYSNNDQRPAIYQGLQQSAAKALFFFISGIGFLWGGCRLAYLNGYRGRPILGIRTLLPLLCFLLGFLLLICARLLDGHEQDDGHEKAAHSDNTVPRKYLLTSTNYWGTVIGIGRTNMPNVLSTDKQVAVISALAEGSGIRQIERITGVHRDTIMRLGVRVGKGCANVLDRKMRNLSCNHLQFDEVWGFIGKKERHCTPDDSPEVGDVWTFCAIDSDTKIVPSFKVGKRDSATANAFVADVASRLKNRVQISSDALRAYVDAVELAFGANVDFAQIVKTYVHEDAQTAERKYSAPEFVIEEKKPVCGMPDMGLASTSHIERLNGTTRLHMRRLTRLTYAFSKKRENFEAAVALHFAYYNFVKRHNTLRCTPAMAAGIERDFWTVRELVEVAA